MRTQPKKTTQEGPAVHAVEKGIEIPALTRTSKYNFKLNELQVDQSRFIEAHSDEEFEAVRHALYNHIVKERDDRDNTVNFVQREAEKNGKRGWRVFCVSAKEHPIRSQRAA